MKRIYAVLLSAALLLSLSACGQPAAGGGSRSEPDNSTPQQTAEPSGSQGVSNQPKEQEPAEDTERSGKVLVAYFSATGNTETVAGYIADTLGAETYEIVPEEPYTSDDLNYNNPDSRVAVEHEDPDLRPAIAGGAIDLSDYDTIFLGFPLWWRQAPHVVLTFLETNDLAGKTVMPFCTSSSSPLGDSANNLHSHAPDANWLDGQRFAGNVKENTVVEWVNSLGIL